MMEFSFVFISDETFSERFWVYWKYFEIFEVIKFDKIFFLQDVENSIYDRHH